MAAQVKPDYAYSIDEAADIFDVTPTTFRRWIAAGLVKAASFSGAKTKRRVMGYQLIALMQDGDGTHGPQ